MKARVRVAFFILLDMLLAYHVSRHSCIPLSPGLKVGLKEF